MEMNIRGQTVKFLEKRKKEKIVSLVYAKILYTGYKIWIRKNLCFLKHTIKKM